MSSAEQRSPAQHSESTPEKQRKGGEPHFENKEEAKTGMENEQDTSRESGRDAGALPCPFLFYKQGNAGKAT